MAERLKQKFPNTVQCFELAMDDQIKRYNEKQGEAVYNCSICKNKGDIAVNQDGVFTLKICDCVNTQNNLAKIAHSGLKDTINAYTLTTYQTSKEWQKQAKAMAMRYISDNFGKWFFAGGQSGAGKTHLCTAITAEFMRTGKTAKYMLWRDDVVRLKANVNEAKEYAVMMNELKNVDVLYIDDFFKTERGKSVTQADINIAFELLNYRYINKHLNTIISSELLIDDIINIDEATGSRIYQTAKDYCLCIGYDKEKNYRLGGAE